MRLVEADATVLFDILKLIITTAYYCNNLTVGASLLVTFFFSSCVYSQAKQHARSQRLLVAQIDIQQQKVVELVLIFNRVFLKLLR